MIFLTSNGLSSPALLDAAKAGIPKGRAALVVTADHAYKAQNWHVPRLTQELQSLGLTVDCFDFDMQSPEELLAYDAAELIGGNPYYLLCSIRRHGFAEALGRFARERCLIGCSAGSLVLTPSLDVIDLYSPEMNFPGLTDLTALGLTKAYLLPHYSKFLTRYEAFEERCAAYEQQSGHTVLRINDGEALLDDGVHTRLIRP